MLHELTEQFYFIAKLISVIALCLSLVEIKLYGKE